MKVARSAVYKIEIQVDCGCRSSADYADPGYRQPTGEPVYSPCEGHQTLGGVMAPVLAEVLRKEASETRPADPRTAVPASAAPAAASPVPASAAPASAGASGPAGADRPPRRLPDRPHRPVPHAIPRAPAVSRVDPAKAAGLGHGGARTASVLAMDMDMVPEDARVTRLIEETNLLGDDADGEDFI